MDWGWIGRNSDMVAGLLGDHLYLALTPILLGLILALPVGFAACRKPWLRPVLLAGSGILYAIPSLALFVVLPGILGTQILDPLNIVIALTVYTFALLARTVMDGLASVSDQVMQAATALGYRRWRQMATVELPIAVPVIIAGVRVATVANISLVSVGALIGTGGLGELFTMGFQRNFFTPIIVGVVLSVVLALVADALLVLAQRVLTPWARARTG